MASFAFVLPVLPGQEESVRRVSEAIGGSGPLREKYEDHAGAWVSTRRRCGSSERP